MNVKIVNLEDIGFMVKLCQTIQNIWRNNMNYKCKCGCTNMFIEKKGNNTGLYCSECGKFQKWLGGKMN